MQLTIALWNANGLAQHTEEVKTYLPIQQVDIMLIAETHFTTRSQFKILNYAIYDTQHPDGTAHGGTAILIKTALNITPNALFQGQLGTRRFKRLYPADLVTNG
jgi:exonuclease III